MEKLDLGALDIVAAIVRAGTLTGAGDVLGMSQPAVSTQLRRIEAGLGRALFHRSPGGCRLTAAGEILWRAAEPALARVEAAVDEIAVMGRDEMLRVTTDFGFAALWLLPNLVTFREAHPGLELQVIASQAPQAPRVGEVAVRFARAGAVTAGARLLIEERVLPVCAPDHPAARQGLDGATLLHLQARTDAPWLDWDGWFADRGQTARPGRGDLRLNTYDLVVQAARAGQGVALGWLPLVEPYLQDGALVAAGPAVHRRHSGYWLEVGPGGGRAATAFADWLRGMMPEVKSGTELEAT
ncbi:MAG: LysR substrate-binding domain-containing protein [Paracoccaceae bacterium]